MTGGFTCENLTFHNLEISGGGTPRGWNSQEVELPEEWNSEKSGTPRGVELPREGNSQWRGTPSRVKLKQVAGHFLKFGELPAERNSVRWAPAQVQDSYANSYIYIYL